MYVSLSMHIPISIYLPHTVSILYLCIYVYVHIYVYRKYMYVSLSMYIPISIYLPHTVSRSYLGIYAYVHIHVHRKSRYVSLSMYMPTYIYLHRGSIVGQIGAMLQKDGFTPTKRRTTPWPLQDSGLFIRGLRTSQCDSWHSTLSLLHPLPLYVAINIAQYMVSPRPTCVAIQHTILVMSILCKGQTTPRHTVPISYTYIHTYIYI